MQGNILELFVVLGSVFALFSLAVVPPKIEQRKNHMREEVVTWAMAAFQWTRQQAECWVDKKFTFFLDGAECRNGLNVRNRAEVTRLPSCLIRVTGSLDIRGTSITIPPVVSVCGRFRADASLRTVMQSTDAVLRESLAVEGYFPEWN